jgi:orotate phosphoribosyltransferase
MTEHSPADLLKQTGARRGHFLLESGHHGDLWLDLELLCAFPRRIQASCSDLARRLQPFQIEVICGPLIEGALVALLVASELNVAFAYSERFSQSRSGGLFPAGYRLPGPLRETVRGKRTAIVNDVINAGSAVRGTFEDLRQCGAHTLAIGTLLTLGDSAQHFADSESVALESLLHVPNRLWKPSECPLCASGVPLEDIPGFRHTLANGAV